MALWGGRAKVRGYAWGTTRVKGGVSFVRPKKFPISGKMAKS